MFSLLHMSFADCDRRPQCMTKLDETDMQVFLCVLLCSVWSVLVFMENGTAKVWTC